MIIINQLSKYVDSRSVVPGSAGGAMASQILADQLTLSQPVGADNAHQLQHAAPRFSDLPTSLYMDSFSAII